VRREAWLATEPASPDHAIQTGRAMMLRAVITLRDIDVKSV